MIQFKYGFDLDNMAIGKYKSKAATAVASGIVVDLNSDGNVEASATGAYFLAQDVSLTGPSYQERQMGVMNYNVKAGDPVLIVPFRSGGVILTDNWTGTAPTAGTTEVEITTGGVLQAYSSGTKIGKVRAAVTDYSITSGTVYEITLY
jgi:hypothetical protein